MTRFPGNHPRDRPVPSQTVRAIPWLLVALAPLLILAIGSVLIHFRSKASVPPRGGAMSAFDFKQVPFDVTRWKASVRGRAAMVTDLKDRVLPGMQKASVIGLLGPPAGDGPAARDPARVDYIPGAHTRISYWVSEPPDSYGRGDVFIGFDASDKYVGIVAPRFY